MSAITLKKNIIVIPARYASKRFPGKPLEKILGKSLIHRVWSVAKRVDEIDSVYITTDSPDIQSHAVGFGAQVIMTELCENGTERVFQAISQLDEKPEIILNLQGDAVLTPPWVIQALLQVMLENAHLGMATPAVLIHPDQYLMLQASKLSGEVGRTMVVCDTNHNALYFSKAMIPYLRDAARLTDPLPLYLHIGLYAYRYAVLEAYVNLKPGILERLEGLEQLRALEHGIPIRVIPVDYRGRTPGSVDSPDDIVRITALIKKEGELASG